MRKLAMALLACGLSVGLAHAQSMSKPNDPKQQSPGTTGAEQNAPEGVARDPHEVQEQQGQPAKSSPGTVGAAPGADTPSQTPKK